MARWLGCLFWGLTFQGVRLSMALLLRPSDFEEEKDIEMVYVFMSAQAGVYAWFENSI